jgi:predicted ATPase
MQNYEYKVVPAPTNGTKAKGVKTVEARFANTLEVLMNKMGAEGWEYQRAETLPSEERSGLMSKSTSYRNVLVFRRSLVAAQADVSAVAPVAAAAAATASVVAAEAEDMAETAQVVEQILPEAEIAPTTVEDTVTDAAQALHETIVDPAVDDTPSEPQPLVASRD